jgi:uncharacterized protein (DUF433 family)
MRKSAGAAHAFADLRIRVKDILDLLANDATADEIVADYSYLELEDVVAALQYAAAQLDHPVLHPA